MNCQLAFKVLAKLPYIEMEVLANELHARLTSMEGWPEFSAADLASSIAAMATELQGTVTEQHKQEQEVLAQLFARKRTISVERQGSGYLVSVPTLKFPSAAGVDLREALAHLLDQTVAHAVLTGGVK